MDPHLCRRPGPSLSGKDGACHVSLIISLTGSWWAGGFALVSADVGACGGAGWSLSLLLLEPLERSRGRFRGHSPPPNPTPTLCCSGWGEGWREMWGWGGGLARSRAEWLPDPQTDGSNFRSRGAGLNCCPERQGPMSVSRKQPQSHTFGPDAALVFVYLTMPEPGAECF